VFFGAGPRTVPSHSRRFDHVRDESGLPSIPDLLRHHSKPAFIDGDPFLIFLVRPLSGLYEGRAGVHGAVRQKSGNGIGALAAYWL
jgi:hypothetical protein